MHFKPGADDNDGAGTRRTQVSAVFLMMWIEIKQSKKKRLGPCDLSVCTECGKVGWRGGIDKEHQSSPTFSCAGEK